MTRHRSIAKQRPLPTPPKTKGKTRISMSLLRYTVGLQCHVVFLLSHFIIQGVFKGVISYHK